ncbi:MAG: hypothetical protein ABJ059_21910 [Hyphomicrobiales bacterium]
MERLNAALSAIIEEIRSEEAGLRARYESEAADASFLEMAQESEGTSKKLDARLEDVTTSLLQSEKRLKNLSLQLTFYADKRTSIEAELKALVEKF